MLTRIIQPASRAGCVSFWIRERPVRYLSKRPGFVVLVAIAAVVLLGLPCYSRRYNSCALCRLGRFDYSCLGIPWSTYRETECTKWYRDQIDARHEHVWVSGSTSTGRNVFETVIWIADGDPRAIFRLT